MGVSQGFYMSYTLNKPLKEGQAGEYYGGYSGHTWSFRSRVYLMKNGNEHGRWQASY